MKSAARTSSGASFLRFTAGRPENAGFQQTFIQSWLGFKEPKTTHPFRSWCCVYFFPIRVPSGTPLTRTWASLVCTNWGVPRVQITWQAYRVQANCGQQGPLVCEGKPLKWKQLWQRVLGHRRQVSRLAWVFRPTTRPLQRLQFWGILRGGDPAPPFFYSCPYISVGTFL